MGGFQRWSEMHSNGEWALSGGWKVKVFASLKTNTWWLGTRSVVSHLIIQHRHSLLCQDWVRQRRQNLRQRINQAWIQITDTDTDMFKAMSTTSLQNCYTTATSSKCSFLLLSQPYQPVGLLNIQRTFILIIVFSQQQVSHVKRHRWWCNNFVLTAATTKSLVASWEVKRET